MKDIYSTTPWLAQAHRLEELGIVEIPGRKNNPDIMFMAKAMRLYYPNDETAWCGLFVGYCLYKANIKDKQPDNILGAKNWKNYGTKISTSEVTPGDILVFWRTDPKGPYGHVGFYIGETKDAYKVLGGNQGNTVSEVWISKKRLLAIRRPFGYKTNPIKQSNNTEANALSTNEG